MFTNFERVLIGCSRDDLEREGSLWMVELAIRLLVRFWAVVVLEFMLVF